MKKLLFLTLFVSFKMFGQSVIIQPSSVDDTEFLKIKKTGIGLDHSTSTGPARVGTYALAGSGYIQTHTPHNLNFTTNNNSAYMTLSYSATAALNGNLGIATSAPQEKLHVVGNIRTSSLVGTGLRPVMADANGTLKPTTAVAFSAYLGVAFPIPTTTSLTVPFGTENYDIGNNYDNSTYEFTAPINGIYHFDVSAHWSSLLATSGGLQIELYGSNPTFTFALTDNAVRSSTYNSWTTNIISVDTKLNIGQTVKVKVIQYTNISLQFNGNYNDSEAVFSGHLVLGL